MKLWEGVIERRLRRETRVSENQFGFMQYTFSEASWRSIEKDKELHMAFLDLEKAHDSVSRELIWRTLIDKGTPRRYLRVIRDMHKGLKTHVRTTIVEVELHPRLAISPYLFTFIPDELSRGIQESIPWCMIFIDDIVWLAESAEGLDNRHGGRVLADHGSSSKHSQSGGVEDAKVDLW
ncbi:retrovirus-related pol polyprotein LINE-1 [Tanacetum coccineum]